MSYSRVGQVGNSTVVIAPSNCRRSDSQSDHTPRGENMVLIFALCLGTLSSSRDVDSRILSPPFNSTWLRSDDADTKLTTLPNGTLSWDGPKHFTGLFTYLPAALPFDKDGAVVNITMRWRSSGEETCPKSCYSDDNWCQQESCQKLKCVSHSVSCLGGTGDFRIALLDTSRSSGKVVQDNWCNGTREYGKMSKCVESEPFAKM